MAEEVRQPIFVVGSPRSGTNLFYYKLASHPDLAWISNITKKVPWSVLFTRLIMLVRRDHCLREAKSVWDRFSRGDDHVLGAGDVTPEARRFLRKVVVNHQRMFNKPRFINKCPRNSVRVDFFNEIFPDAYFIHIIRDGRAVAHSILRARQKHKGIYWGVRPERWRDLLEMPLIEACGLQWRKSVEAVLRSAEKLPPERYIEVRYEEFCRRPADVLLAVGEKCGLRWERKHLEEITGDVEIRNYKWSENLKPEEIARLNELLGDLLVRLGYEV